MGFQHHQNHPFFAQLGWEEHGSRAPELKLAGFLLQAFGPSSHVMQVPRHGPGVAGPVLAPPSPKDEFATEERCQHGCLVCFKYDNWFTG